MGSKILHKNLIISLVCPFLFLAMPASSRAATQAVTERAGGSDFSGIEQFLKLTAVLERDREPPAEQWDRLFSTPGYAVLLEREFRRDFFVERFKQAFMPSKKAELAVQIKKDTGFYARYLPHFLRAKAMRTEIEKRVGELRAMDVHGAAIARAKTLLPKSETFESPTVAFVIFAPDARGYDPVVIDVLYSISRKERFADFVAHEFHHWYRNKLVDLNQDRDTLWVINQVHAEGIADLVDKADWPKKPAASLSPEEKRYHEFFDKSPDVIRTMDGLLARMAGLRTGRGELGEQLSKAVPQSGHPTGLFMAGLILEELGRDVLVQTVANPFEFFRLYNAAAKKRGGDIPRFSEIALAFLANLEKRFLN